MVDEANGTASPPIRLTYKQLDAMIAKILNFSFEEFTQNVSIAEICQLCSTATNVLKGQEPFVDIQPPVIVCGDIHGQFADLKRIFNMMGHPPSTRYLFLGDIVDRGDQSLETIVLLLCYKVRYPMDFYVLRGNHECASINRTYGFYDEIGQRYGQQNAESLWKQFNLTFAWMPYVGLIGGRILCMHGGITPELTNMEQLRALRRPFIDPPCPSLELDLLWADPARDISGIEPNERGVSIRFGADVVHDVVNHLDIDLIVRAHQCVKFGAEFFADAQLLTIFTAPNYQTEHNIGAMLLVGPLPRTQMTFKFLNSA